ncbi:MAG TPA: DUF6131 family protein [Acidimicrobiales bacterium]|nr:DUF6131 family protein [Acidimicrobiales bacterium]
MIMLGFVLALIGFLAAIPILWSLGVTVLVFGIILMVLGTLGHEVGGRRHYY